MVDVEALDEGHLVGRGEAHDRQARPGPSVPSDAEGGLGRGAGDHQHRCAEEVVVAEEVVDQEGGEEQRVEQHLPVLVVGTGAGRVDEAVPAVGAGHGLAVGGDVAEAAVVHPAHGHHQLLGHGEVAEAAAAHRQLGVGGLDHVGVAPHRHPAPALLGGEEVPVLEHVADDGVGDVVGAQAEGVDAQPGLALVQRRRVELDDAHLVEIAAVDLQVHDPPKSIDTRGDSTVGVGVGQGCRRLPGCGHG